MRLRFPRYNGFRFLKSSNNLLKRDDWILRRCFYDSSRAAVQKLTIKDIEAKYKAKTPLITVTAYDIVTSRCAHLAEVDMILVGDSLGMVVYGDEGTNQVTIEEMVRHCRAVTNVELSFTPFIVGDMPFTAYLTSEAAVTNAAKLICEGGCDAVKMEGGERVEELVKTVIKAGIPVMGHLGLTPQTPSSIGGFKVQGTCANSALAIHESAKYLQSVGCFSIVLEAVPHKIATHITRSLSVPTIGIGAGAGCSGQVQVVHDISGMFHKFLPKFSKRYRLVGPQIEAAIASYKQDVLNGEFPAKQHSFTIRKSEYEQYLKLIGTDESSPTNAASPVGQLINNTFDDEFQTCRSVTSHINKKRMKIAVIGGGAMGSLMSFKLANQGGFQVTLVSSWKKQVEAVNQTGLKLFKVGLDGRVLSQSVTENSTNSGGCLKALPTENISNSLGSNKGGFEESFADVVFILTKANLCRSAARVASNIVTPNAVVVTLQNGAECASIIKEELSEKGAVVIDGSTSHAATMSGPGNVWHTGESLTIIGSTTKVSKDNESSSSQPEASKLVSEILNESGFETQIAETRAELQRIKWTKLGVNCVINPLTAILGVRNAYLLGDPSVNNLAQKLVSEFVSVAKASVKKDVLSGIDESELLKKVYEVAAKTGQNKSSMLSDILRGANTEIDYLNGFVVREANKLHIEVPCHETVTNLIKILQTVKGQTSKGECGDSEIACTEPETEEAKQRSEPIVVSTVNEFRSLSQKLGFGNKKVGFVPTMGGLHEGHLTLVRQCRSICDITVVSIFVNPLQFAPHEDFNSYPRDLQGDLSLLQAEGVDFVFAPSGSDLVPEKPSVTLSVHGSEDKPEGQSRPHFFHGVATIVMKLLNIVKPNVAFFGQKDAQQCSVVKQLVVDLNMDCEIVIGDTVRETDGLAMSTRNKHLSCDERKAASVIYDALSKAKKAFEDGERNVIVLKTIVKNRLREESLFQLQYVSISDNFSMEQIGEMEQSLQREGVSISVAGWIGKTRLIDNIVLTS